MGETAGEFALGFATRALPVLGMKKPAVAARPPLLRCEAHVIKRCLIRVEASAGRIRSQHIHVLRSEIEDLSKLTFALTNFVFRPLGHSDIGHRTHKIQVACLYRAADDAYVLDAT